MCVLNSPESVALQVLFQITELENLRFAGHEGKQTKCSDKGGGASASALQLLLISVLSVVLMWDMQNEENQMLSKDEDCLA